MEYEQTSLAVAQRCSGLSSSTPLFSALINYLHGGDRDSSKSLPSPYEVIASKGGTSYPLVLSVEDHPTTFGLEVECDESVDPHRVLGYVQQAALSLVKALEESDTTVAASLSILPDSERQQVIERFNPPHLEPSAQPLIHNRFETQVRRAPDADAVVYQGEALTYDALNNRANQLARHLRGMGVGPEDLVAICVDRGLDMLVSIIGTLKAGCAYLPLDPAHPSERLAYMLEDAQPPVVLIHEHLRAKVPVGAHKLISLDREWADIAHQETDNLSIEAENSSPSRLAYVIYTSGSTGKPKGVMVEHGNVMRLLHATQSWFRFDEQDVWTFFHSFAFDFSVWELWCALLYGGRVVVVPHLTSRSPQQFYRLICTEQVTILNQTPSAFAQLIEAQEREKEHHSLRVVIFGGEALELRSLLPWAQRNDLARTRLVNMYGITETTVHVTYHSLPLQEIESESGSVVGRRIPDLRVYI